MTLYEVCGSGMHTRWNWYHEYVTQVLVQVPQLMMLFIRFFFFSSRRRHTRFDCDWSSDVCSSDLVVHDCGRLINPLIVEGQIQGGVAHGIGNAFYEQLVYDHAGQLLNASLMDYLLPTATDVPAVETAHRATPAPPNPVGGEGVGGA